MPPNGNPHIEAPRKIGPAVVKKAVAVPSKGIDNNAIAAGCQFCSSSGAAKDVDDYGDIHCLKCPIAR